MHVRAAQLFSLIAIGIAAFVFGASPAHAWTYEDCVEVDFNHPDCEQYPTTTTTEATSTSTTSTSSSTTTAPTSSSVPTSSTFPATSSTILSTVPANETTSTTPSSTPKTSSTTGSCDQPRGCPVATFISETEGQLPFTGVTMLGPIVGFGSVIAGGVALALSRRRGQ